MVGKTLSEQLLDMCEMANFRQKDTGLPMVVWIQTKSGREKHGPRLKVQNNHSNSFNIENTVVVTISDSPVMIPDKSLSNEDFNAVVGFIKLNKEALLDYWEGRLSTVEFIQELNKV